MHAREGKKTINMKKMNLSTALTLTGGSAASDPSLVVVFMDKKGRGDVVCASLGHLRTLVILMLWRWVI